MASWVKWACFESMKTWVQISSTQWKNLDIAVHACNLSTRGQRQVDPESSLARQPISSNKLLVQWETLSQAVRQIVSDRGHPARCSALASADVHPHPHRHALLSEPHIQTYKRYFQCMVDWICGQETHNYGGLTVWYCCFLIVVQVRGDYAFELPCEAVSKWWL